MSKPTGNEAGPGMPASRASHATVTWNYPTHVVFGPGASRQMPEHCRQQGMSNPLLVTDQGLRDVAFIGDLLQLCRDSGLAMGLFSEVQGNPTDANLAHGLSHYRRGNHDGVVAVGGGSALDVGKTIALIAGQTGSLWALGGEAGDWSWIAESEVAPLIAVPTTAGTGSEVGRCAVITDQQQHSKRLICHPRMMPPVVLCDPRLTLGLPAPITAATGLDAFVHCFEAFVAPGFHPMADGIALEGMRLIATALPRAFADGGDLEARSQLMAAASMGATAFQKGLGAVHALAHPLGALYNVHHGLANAILLPYVMVANRPAIEGHMELLGRVLDLEKPDFAGLLGWVLELREQLQIPHTLREIELDDSCVERVSSLAVDDPSAQSNPVAFKAADYAGIIRHALEGRLY